MSLASDIVRDAIERGRRIADNHAQRVHEVAGEFGEHVGRPWKYKLDLIQQRKEKSGGEPSEP